MTVGIEDLRREPLAATIERMERLCAMVRAGEREGTILLVEHEPVYTAGRGTPAHEIPEGAVRVSRGGKVTYHGPGQLVVYPVVRLPKKDLKDWLSRLERFGIAVCARFGLRAQGSVDGTGVFVGRGKVASIGVAVKHWISIHGIAINVNMDLRPWARIRPCGLDPEVMTDLSRCCGRELAMREAEQAVRDSVLILGTDAAGV